MQRVLSLAVDDGTLVGVVAAAWSRHQLIFEGVAGNASASQPMELNTMFAIASMTKTVTAVAAMKLVEEGRVSLDAPAGDFIPFLGRVPVLVGFNDDGTAQLRPATRAVTLRHLLTHTSGFGYEFNNELLMRYVPTMPTDITNPFSRREQPLTFDPGDRWQYSIGLDWVGRIVEEISGVPLERYFREQILEPLGMDDTTYFPSSEQKSRCAVLHRRVGRSLAPEPFPFPDRSEVPRGGGGLYSTVVDYARLTRMLLNGGEFEGTRVLKSETVSEMASNQLGALTAPGWSTCNAMHSNNVSLFPYMRTGWGLSFLMNLEKTQEGRSANSLAWAGIANSYFWIDREAGVSGVFATQVLPGFDPGALSAFSSFERAVYATVSR